MKILKSTNTVSLAVLLTILIAIFVNPTFASQNKTKKNTSVLKKEESVLKEIVEFMANQGGMNSGGGNSIANSPIENYRRDFKTLRGFKEVTEPILNRIESRIPGLKKEILYKAERQLWLLVPVNLTLLPQKISGIPTETSQGAINTKDIVWISEPVLNSKTIYNAGVHLFHEIIMSSIRGFRELETSDLISETLKQTSAFLDGDQISDDVEYMKYLIKMGVTGYMFTMNRQETWYLLPKSLRETKERMDREAKRISSELNAENSKICELDRVDVLLREALSNKLQAQDAIKLSNSLRKMLVNELRILFAQGDMETVSMVATKNQIYRNEIETGMQLSPQFDNKEFNPKEFTMVMNGGAAVFYCSQFPCLNGNSEIGPYTTGKYVEASMFIFRNYCSYNQLENPRNQFGWPVK